MWDVIGYVCLVEWVNGCILFFVDWCWFWGEVLVVFENIVIDVCLINLEMMIIVDGEFVDCKLVCYWMYLDNVLVLMVLWLYVCVLVNNYIFDFGYQGLIDMVVVFVGVGIQSVGVGVDLFVVCCLVLVMVGYECWVIVGLVVVEFSGVFEFWVVCCDWFGVWLIWDLV